MASPWDMTDSEIESNFTKYTGECATDDGFFRLITTTSTALVYAPREGLWYFDVTHLGFTARYFDSNPKKAIMMAFVDVHQQAAMVYDRHRERRPESPTKALTARSTEPVQRRRRTNRGTATGSDSSNGSNVRRRRRRGEKPESP